MDTKPTKSEVDAALDLSHKLGGAVVIGPSPRGCVLATADAEEIGLLAAARKHDVTVSDILATSFSITGTRVHDEESFRRAHRDWWESRIPVKSIGGGVIGENPYARQRADALGSYTFWLGRDAA